MKTVLKNGLEVVIREVTLDDVNNILAYMDQIHKETKNLSREPEEFNMTYDQEYEFINNSIESENHAFIVATYNDQIISCAGIHGSGLKRLKHRVTLGISILEAYRGVGLGKAIMNRLVELAKKQNKLKIDLQVRTDNKTAIALYEKIGFEHEGVIKDGFYVDERFVDLAVMGLRLGGTHE